MYGWPPVRFSSVQETQRAAGRLAGGLVAGADAAEQLEVAVDVDAAVGLAALALHALEVEVREAELVVHVVLLTHLRRLARVQRSCAFTCTFTSDSIVHFMICYMFTVQCGD